jgi:hypothetical protein
MAYGTTESIWTRQSATQGFAGTLGRSGYQTAFIGKAHFATKSTFKPTGTPECKQSQAAYGPSWFGPYMGFEHVELCVLGHLHRTRAIDRPPAGHYERWLISRGRNEEALKLWATGLPPDVGAAQTWNSALPAAWHNSTGLPIGRSTISSSGTDEAILRLGIISRSASCIRLPRAVVAAIRSGQYEVTSTSQKRS